MECNFQDKTQSVDISEYYDYPNQRAAVFEEEYGFHAQGIYSYNTNEFFNIEDQLRKYRTIPTSSSSFKISDVSTVQHQLVILHWGPVT